MPHCTGIILTAGCFFVYFMTFKSYGVSAKAIFMNNNNFFPSAGSSTDDNPLYLSDNGKAYNADDQNRILFIVQGKTKIDQVLQ